MKKPIRFLLIGVVLFLALLWPLIVSSQTLAISDPSFKNIHDIVVYRGLVETNDFLAVVPYTIYYPTTPDTAIDQAFIFQLRNGSTLLGSVTAYPYHLKGEKHVAPLPPMFLQPFLIS